MNGTGYGVASVNVTSATLRSNKVSTPAMNNPSAAMTNTPTYFVGAPLPAGASAATIARIKGSAGYVWKATTVGSNGDKTDNEALERRVQVRPADCAVLEMESAAAIAPDEKSGSILVNARATAGTALWLRGYEYTDPTPPQSVEDLETNPNSVLKWDVLMVGPFDLSFSNCTQLTVPFTIDTSISNLYFVTDGVAKSNPLLVVCPSNIVVNCGEPVAYGPVLFAGCGDVRTEFNPPPGTRFAVGTTPVTVTATDRDGNVTNCVFTVTVQDTVPPQVPELAVLRGEASVVVPVPVALDVCGAETNVIAGTTSDPLEYREQGTYVVRWRFDDGHGNTVVSNQTVVVQDLTPPVPPVLADVLGECSATVTQPVAQDAVAGAIPGVTTSPLTFTTQGTNLVTWVFDDGHGNVALQWVYVHAGDASHADDDRPMRGRRAGPDHHVFPDHQHWHHRGDVDVCRRQRQLGDRDAEHHGFRAQLPRVLLADQRLGRDVFRAGAIVQCRQRDPDQVRLEMRVHPGDGRAGAGDQDSGILESMRPGRGITHGQRGVSERLALQLGHDHVHERLVSHHGDAARRHVALCVREDQIMFV